MAGDYSSGAVPSLTEAFKPLQSNLVIRSRQPLDHSASSKADGISHEMVYEMVAVRFLSFVSRN